MTKAAQTEADKKAAAKAAAAKAASKAKAAARPSPEAETTIQAANLKPTKSAKHVTVASKLPMNITLQLCAKQVRRIPGQNGVYEETVYVPQGRGFIIRGTAYPSGKVPKGFPKQPGMIEDANGGYAMTPGVDADFMAEWMRQNAETDMVRNGLIKVQADLDDLAADAREHESVNSGLGPLVPDTDHRNPKPLNLGVSDVTMSVRGA